MHPPPANCWNPAACSGCLRGSCSIEKAPRLWGATVRRKLWCIWSEERVLEGHPEGHLCSVFFKHGGTRGSKCLHHKLVKTTSSNYQYVISKYKNCTKPQYQWRYLGVWAAAHLLSSHLTSNLQLLACCFNWPNIVLCFCSHKQF